MALALCKRFFSQTASCAILKTHFDQKQQLCKHVEKQFSHVEPIFGHADFRAAVLACNFDRLKPESIQDS